MTLGLMSADDPVGSLVPEADGAHGEISVHDLLTMTSGLRWNGFRDYNIFTMPDRIRDALTLEVVKRPGTYFEYAQSAVSLLAEVVGRSAGEDVMAFAQRELMGPLGIEEGSWDWTRDRAGHVGGFYGVQMTPDDYGRLGDLLRRGGVWNGRRLLSREYVRRAVEPSKTNGCYGWLIWVNAAAPCIGPTVVNRPVENSRDFPDLPADFYNFSGLFGQRVTVFPTQDIVIVRTGQDPGLVPAGQASWEHELYVRVLGAITDQKIDPPADAPRVNEEREDVDYGFGSALSEPDQYSKGTVQDPLPPAGPARARATLFRTTTGRVGRRGVVRIRLACPPRWPAREISSCIGQAKLKGAKTRRYRIGAGKAKTVRFRLHGKTMRALRRKRSLALGATARNADAAGGTVTRSTIRARYRP
jgi:CubicO group peptidase (beta-lactamase class C family)